MSEWLIILSFAFIVYTYFGYPLLLRIWGRRPAAPVAASDVDLPPVTVVIAAFNEAGCIGETLSSILASDYPAEALDVVVVSDVSSDRTDEIVRSFPGERVRLKRQAERAGQSLSLLQGAAMARGEIVIIADASGVFFPDTVRRLVRPFVDSKVGAVSGHKVIRETGTAVSKGDRAYLDYDTVLRYRESCTGSSWVGCQGGLFAIRKPLFAQAFPLDIAADNATCYRLYEKGFLHLFDPNARVAESPSQDLKMEFRRKIRIIVLGMRGVVYFRHLFVPWKHPAFFFQNMSHKLFRWMVPFALVAMWAASAISAQPWARLFFWLQCAFYALALCGILVGRRRSPRWLSIPAYFTTVNLAGLLAWAALSRNYTVWAPPARSAGE